METTAPDPIALALGLLFTAFPSGLNDQVKVLYLSELRRQKPDPVDVAEMAQRVLHTRESRTVPPLAEILKRLRESRTDRLKGEYETPQLEQGQLRRLTQAEKDDVRVWRALAKRGVHHCDVKGWQTGGYCGCKRLCWGEGVSASEAKSKLEWAIAEEIALPPREGSKDATRLGDVLGSGQVSRIIGGGAITEAERKAIHENTESEIPF